jgi:hypothetical protein
MSVETGAPQVPRLLSHDEAADAWGALDRGFARASSIEAETVEPRSWRIGGRPVRQNAVGRELAERTRMAFAHLRADDPGPHRPALTIDLWDGEATGVCPPRGTILDAIPGWHEGGGMSTISSDSRYYVHGLFESRAILDRQAGRILCWTASSRRLSLYERGKPLRVLLSVWLHDRGIQLVHAALVASRGRGVILPGRGGAGKSTSALTCLLAGFEYLGDDYIGLEPNADGSFTGYSLYDSTWLDPAHLLRFPPLVPHALAGVIPWERKRLVHLSNLFRERLAPCAPIRILALPRVAGVTTRTRPASRAEALLAAAPTSVFELTPRVGAPGVQRLATLVSRLPAYWLELGEDLGEIPRRLEALLDEIGA